MHSFLSVGYDPYSLLILINIMSFKAQLFVIFTVVLYQWKREVLVDQLQEWFQSDPVSLTFHLCFIPHE